MSDPQTLLRSFQELYHTTPRLFSAPGRINLIGEHTDCTTGLRLPSTTPIHIGRLGAGFARLNGDYHPKRQGLGGKSQTKFPSHPLSSTRKPFAPASIFVVRPLIRKAHCDILLNTPPQIRHDIPGQNFRSPLPGNSAISPDQSCGGVWRHPFLF
jgi:hypothetical protein